MNTIYRNQSSKMYSYLELFPVVALIGVRQCGKTNLARSLFPTWKYFDLEKPSDYNLIKNDIELFFKQNEENIIIDEAQLLPELFNVLRHVIDENRESKGRFILTGSSSPELSKNLSESLAGRVGVIEMSPLKANETAQKPLSDFYKIFNTPLTKQSLNLETPFLTEEELHTAWLLGGYPEPVLSNRADFLPIWMENYRNSYLNRDLAKLFPGINAINYQRFLGLLSNYSGTILNKSEMARTLEVSEGTIRNYLDIAQGTFIWKMINSFEKDSSKSITKMPKGYIRDSGLAHHLLHIYSLDQLYQHPIVGHSFENFIIEEIIRGLSSTTIVNWNTHYFRTKNGAEIDLVLEGPFGVLPIEIKYGTHTKIQKLKSLSDFIERNNLPFGLLINQSTHATWITDNIFQLPAVYV